MTNHRTEPTYAVAVQWAATPGVADPAGEHQWIPGFEPKAAVTQVTPVDGDLATARRVATSVEAHVMIGTYYRAERVYIVQMTEVD